MMAWVALWEARGRMEVGRGDISFGAWFDGYVHLVYPIFVFGCSRRLGRAVEEGSTEEDKEARVVASGCSAGGVADRETAVRRRAGCYQQLESNSRLIRESRGHMGDFEFQGWR